MPSSEVEILLARKSDTDSMSCRMREKSQHYFFSFLRVSSRSKNWSLVLFYSEDFLPSSSDQEFETGRQVDEKLD